MKTVQEIKAAIDSGKMTGLIPGVPISVYHDKECPGYSSSFLKDVYRYSYGHALAWREKPKSESDGMTLGRAVHTLILEPHLYEKEFCFLPEGIRRDKRNKDYTALLESGKTILTFDQAIDAKFMAQNVLSSKTFQRLFRGAKIEHSAWMKDEFGTWLKARSDLFTTDNIVVDIKTTSSFATPEQFAKTVSQYSYHVSAAMYLDIIGKIVGEKLTKFVFVVVESTYPYKVAFFPIDSERLEIGRSIYRLAIDKIHAYNNGLSDLYYPDEFQDLPSY